MVVQSSGSMLCLEGLVYTVLYTVNLTHPFVVQSSGSMLCLESLVYTLVLAFWAYDEYFIVGRRETHRQKI